MRKLKSARLCFVSFFSPSCCLLSHGSKYLYWYYLFYSPLHLFTFKYLDLAKMEPKHTIELLVLHDSVVLIRPAQCKQEEPILDGDDLEFASSDDVDPGRCQREILIHKFSGTFHSCAIGGGEQRNNRDGIEKQV